MLDILEKGISEKAFEAVLANTPEWLKQTKQNAWETYNNLTKDNKVQRREKFRDVIDSLELENIPSKSGFGSAEDLETLRAVWGNLSASVSLNSDQDLVSEEFSKSGIILKSLKKALVENEELVKPYLNTSLLTSKDSRFTALAEAMWQDGIFLYVPKDTALNLPLHLLKYIVDGNTQNYYKNLIVVESGSNVIVIDEYNSKTEEFFLSNGLNDIRVKDSATLVYMHLQNYDYNGFGFSLQRASIGKDATLRTLSLSIGSQFSYQNIRSYMESEGSKSEILGLVIGNEEQVFQHETLQYHPVENASSDLHFEVMLKDKAESAHNGFVQIEKTAQQSNAHQLIRNLLLSRNAKAEAIPNLEILADDVKCSHGVSLGPVNYEELFYLMSRGFTQEESENLIIQGNIENIINQLIDIEIEDDEDVVEDEFQDADTLASRLRNYIISGLE